MRFISGALIALALCACGKDYKKDEAKTEASKPPAEAKKPADPAPPATTPTTPPPAATSKLTCDKVVPQSLRDKHYPGATVDGKPSSMGVDCTIMKDADITILSAVCPSWDEATFEQTMKTGKEAMEGTAKDVAVGKQGYIGEQMGMKMLQFRDDDTPCFVTVAGGTADLEAVGKEIAAALTPAALGG